MKTHKLHSLASHWGLVLILLAFVALGVVYSVVTPLFETPDEVWHFQYLRHIAQTAGLPVQDATRPGPWKHEGSQPPLYYILTAALTAWVNTGDAEQIIVWNPHAAPGLPLFPGDKAVFIHHPPLENWPWRGTVLAVHLARLLSVLAGAGTVVLTYALARQVIPAEPWVAVGAAAMVAFVPQFIFISAAVSNDALISALSAATLYLAAVRLRQPATSNQAVVESSDRRRGFSQSGNGQLKPRLQLLEHIQHPLQAALLGGVAGLATLSKVSGLGLLPLALVAIAWRTRPWRQAARDGLYVLAAWMAVAGWWFVRNQFLYGDPFGARVMAALSGDRGWRPGLEDLIGEAQGVWLSFWGVFGWFNILAEPWVYQVFSVLAGVALLGLLLMSLHKLTPASWEKTPSWKPWAKRAKPYGLPVSPEEALLSERMASSLAPGFQKAERHPPDAVALVGLAAWIGISVAGLAWFTRLTPSSQGRLLFPALPAAGVLLFFGLSRWVPIHLRPVLAACTTLGLAVIASSIPFRVIAPAYAPPERRPLESTAIPQRLDVTFDSAPGQPFDGQLRLIGYDLPHDTVTPGQSLPVTLYWQSLSPVDEDYSVFVHLSGDPELPPIAQWDALLGGPTFPTSVWRTDEIVITHFAVPVPAERSIRPAAQYTLAVGVYRFKDMVRLTPQATPGVVISDARVFLQPVRIEELRGTWRILGEVGKPHASF